MALPINLGARSVHSAAFRSTPRVFDLISLSRRIPTSWNYTVILRKTRNSLLTIVAGLERMRGPRTDRGRTGSKYSIMLSIWQLLGTHFSLLSKRELLILWVRKTGILIGIFWTHISGCQSTIAREIGSFCSVSINSGASACITINLVRQDFREAHIKCGVCLR